MVKLTADLVASAETYVNPLHDRELDLRGYRIPVLEHLGACRDQIDSLNVMDNDLRVLGGPWPSLPRLRHVYLANNKIQSIEPGFHVNVPFLETLILTNNQLADLKDIRHLHLCRSLRYLSCLGNPVTKHKLYRMYLVYHVPQLRVLDFQRIKMKERMAARNYFSNISPALLHPEQPSARPNAEEEDMELQEEEEEEDQDQEDQPQIQSTLPRLPPSSLSPEDILKIKEAIQNANSLAEIQKLEELLQRGKLPASFVTTKSSSKPQNDASFAASTQHQSYFSEDIEEMDQGDEEMDQEDEEVEGEEEQKGVLESGDDDEEENGEDNEDDEDIE